MMCGKYDPKISSVDGRRVSDENQAKGIYWGINTENFPYGIYHYSTMYLTATTAREYIDHMNSNPPEVLRGYPSGISSLANYIKQQNLKLNFQLKAIYLTSENILEEHVKVIEEVFGCKVWGQYGHSETSIFAFRKPNSEKYYCFPQYGITEIIKDNGQHAEIGEMGEIVVTGFTNTALPFIRYKTGDLAVFGGIQNGYVVLEKLLGRSGDYIINANGDKIYLVGFIFGGHLSIFNHVENWQIVQNEPAKLDINIIKSKSYTQQVESELINFLADNGFNANIQYVENILKTSRGKQKFLIQNVK